MTWIPTSTIPMYESYEQGYDDGYDGLSYLPPDEYEHFYDLGFKEGNEGREKKGIDEIIRR